MYDIIHLWHNTQGDADQYFVRKGEKILFRIPKWLGRLLMS